MRPTDYSRRITVQNRTRTTNQTGGWSDTWNDYYSSWASVVPIKGVKRLEYGQMGMTEMYEVEMRKRANNVDKNCRVVFDSKNFQIENIVIDQERVFLDIVRK